MAERTMVGWRPGSRSCSILWAYLSIQGMKRVMALLTSCRLLGIAGRPRPGITGFLSARGIRSFKGLVLYVCLKDSPIPPGEVFLRASPATYSGF